MDSIEKAFLETPRWRFVPPASAAYANENTALPIGYGQTISQPTTVKQMLRWLNVLPGQRILDVGSGSGWTTALLSRLTGDSGSIWAVELVPQLVAFGQQNCQRVNIRNATFHKSFKSYGWPTEAPFDRQLVSASADRIPDELLDQLKVGGKLVGVEQHNIVEITKTSDQKYLKIDHPGYIFVPLKSPDSHI